MPQAKNISKVYKVIAPAGVLICAILKWTGVMPQATIGEIGAVWSIIYGLGAGTIDVNLMMEKFSHVKSNISNGDSTDNQ